MSYNDEAAGIINEHKTERERERERESTYEYIPIS
jgi:hypothetical protein